MRQQVRQPRDVTVTFTEPELVVLSDILRRVGPEAYRDEDGQVQRFSPRHLALCMEYFTNDKHPQYRTALKKINAAKLSAWEVVR